jgi:hypothetical protein
VEGRVGAGWEAERKKKLPIPGVITIVFLPTNPVFADRANALSRSGTESENTRAVILLER